MRLDVHVVGDLALIERVPDLCARVLFGRATVETYAVRRGGVWTDDQTGRRVAADVEAAIRAVTR